MYRNLILALVVVSVSGKGFLSETGHGLDVHAFQADVDRAMDMALGCGGGVKAEHLLSIEQDVAKIWLSLHKISEGHIDRRTLRYLVHRFFDRRSALHIRGFEPSRPVNTSSWGDADILSQRVPAFVEAVLESKHKTEIGFNLKDATLMIATIQQLVFDSETTVLEKVYATQGFSRQRSLNHQELAQVLRTYLVRWMVGDDEESVSILLSNQSLLTASIPHWDKLVSMADGRARTLQYQRQRDPKMAIADGLSRPGHNALSARFSFDDAHRVVGGITVSFASYWESECQSMKTALVEMDTHRTGRVPLSKFYSSALDSEWRFGESESYLRELGALDETSWRGKQVIIPNYIQGASNCIVTTAHYLVCCINECEALLGELEIAVGMPVAEPVQLLTLIKGMNSQTSVDDDFPPALDKSLIEQLEKIAASHGGLVPIHGRLFAQWLHYVFPRECPFPHKVGSSTKLTPLEFGDQYLAQGEEMQRHAQEVNVSIIPSDMGRDELQWMSQWSQEEELISERAAHGLHAPWTKRSYAKGGAAIALVAGLGIFLMQARGKVSEAGSVFQCSKSHMV